MTLKKGDALGLYQIEGPLGLGGMGEIYRAWDPRLHRWVAIKVLPKDTSHASARKRFEIEAKAVASMSHPNILVIHDVGSHRNMHYAVTELLEGETLRSRLERGRIPWQEVLRIAASITDALAAAHSKGVVHRDLKPENIFLTWDERVKILDFGLAFFDIRLNPMAPASRPTPPGTVIGTSGYMAPEQFLGEEVDHRADIFALGCLLHEMLSGRRTFPSRSIGEAVTALLEKQPSAPSELVTELPPELDDVVSRCLAKVPSDRFQLAASVGVALRRLEPEPDSTPGFPNEPPADARFLLRTIAVLPFGVEGPDGTPALSDGICESILRALRRRDRPRVIAWGTSSRYRDSPLPPAEIGRALAVDAVLTGRAMLDEKRMIVTVELISSRDGELLWGERYDHRFADVFNAQDQIAGKISRHLERHVDGPSSARSAPTSSEAYRLYLRGRYFWNKASPQHVERSQASFERALAEDPSSALAHAGLADTLNAMPFWGLAAPRDAFPRADKAARRALEIDPWLAEARAAAAYVSFFFDWDWPTARAGFKKAIDLRPDYVPARRWYGLSAALMGDFETAFEQFEQAQEIDSLSLATQADLALIFYLSGAPERAVEPCRAAQELDLSFAPTSLYHGLALEQMERFDDAVEALEEAVELTDQAVVALAALAHCLARAGEHRQAERALAKLFEIRHSRYLSSYQIALIYCGLGDVAETFRFLSHALEERSEMMVYFEIDPRFAKLRTDPRAREVLKRMKKREKF